ncbi:hypothetical protein IV38_GL001180 [Lactobacillus selangorensis]|uniref:Maltose phosphorylase n=1 Tax=Lactobacillus selangorensis TaxID=81857 RepID=A0A0R2FU03_9LACO|nr:hypothetical protein IV38_GL001180 [Lactobacillus selangorensis]
MSPAIYAIVAAKIGDAHKAKTLLKRTALTDIADQQGNTKDGLHTAAMGGSWLILAYGIARMTIGDKMLSFEPYLPKSWNGYQMEVLYHGSLLQLQVKRDNDLVVSEIHLLDGDPVPVHLNGKLVDF